jgi:hypothetical protein
MRRKLGDLPPHQRVHPQLYYLSKIAKSVLLELVLCDLVSDFESQFCSTIHGRKYGEGADL